MLITVTLNDNRVIRGDIDSLLISSISSPITSIEIDHPKSKVNIANASFYFLFKEKVVVTGLGSLRVLNVGYFNGVDAVGYSCSDQDLGFLKYDLNKFSKATLNKIIKPGA
jgi:hypothetical protein